MEVPLRDGRGGEVDVLSEHLVYEAVAACECQKQRFPGALPQRVRLDPCSREVGAGPIVGLA